MRLVTAFELQRGEAFFEVPTILVGAKPIQIVVRRPAPTSKVIPGLNVGRRFSVGVRPLQTMTTRKRIVVVNKGVQQAPGFQHAADFLDHQRQVSDVLKNRDGDHQVELLRLEWIRTDNRSLHTNDTPLAASRDTPDNRSSSP